MIHPTLLRNALATLDVKPETDLFASRLNRQFPIYCSFRPDPGASCIDAFTISWTEKNFILFHLLVVFSECFRKLFRTGTANKHIMLIRYYKVYSFN